MAQLFCAAVGNSFELLFMDLFHWIDLEIVKPLSILLRTSDHATQPSEQASAPLHVCFFDFATSEVRRINRARASSTLRRDLRQ